MVPQSLPSPRSLHNHYFIPLTTSSMIPQIYILYFDYTAPLIQWRSLIQVQMTNWACNWPTLLSWAAHVSVSYSKVFYTLSNKKACNLSVMLWGLVEKWFVWCLIGRNNSSYWFCNATKSTSSVARVHIT